MRVTVIVPSLPPSACGLGGYTVQLWRHLVAGPSPSLSLDQALGWEFLVVHSADKSRKLFPLATIAELPLKAEQLADKLDRMNATCVLLQYECYSYDPHGVARYLVEGLRRWQGGMENRKLIVMFHEAWADGPPWKSAYWYSQQQRDVAKQLIDLADVAVTSNHHYKNMLESLRPNKEVLVIGIGSNFGVDRCPRLNWRQALIFGLNRSTALLKHRELLKVLYANKLVTGLVLAGRSSTTEDAKELKIACSILPRENIVQELDFDFDYVPMAVRECGLSLIDVDSHLLPKSGRFHLACMLGQIAIAQTGLEPGQPLEDGVNFLSYAPQNKQKIIDALKSETTLLQISDEAHKLSTDAFSWSKAASAWRQVLPLNDSGA